MNKLAQKMINEFKTSGRYFRMDGTLKANIVCYVDGIIDILSGGKYHYEYVAGTGRHAYLHDVKEIVFAKSFLTRAGVKFDHLNDAPRGGRLGNYYQFNDKYDVEAVKHYHGLDVTERQIKNAVKEIVKFMEDSKKAYLDA